MQSLSQICQLLFGNIPLDQQIFLYCIYIEIQTISSLWSPSLCQNIFYLHYISILLLLYPIYRINSFRPKLLFLQVWEDIVHYQDSEYTREQIILYPEKPIYYYIIFLVPLHQNYLERFLYTFYIYCAIQIALYTDIGLSNWSFLVILLLSSQEVSYLFCFM